MSHFGDNENMRGQVIFHSLLLLTMSSVLSACAGKYIIKSYPPEAKVYIRDINTNEKKLIGTTPTEIKEDTKMGDVFFLTLEKDNYKPKDIMVKVNQGESIAVSARMDPLLPGEMDAAVAKKDDENKPQDGSPKKDDEPKDWQQEIADMKLRIALLENTTAFYKDAIFSPRLAGGVPSSDRDRKEKVVGLVFEAQQAIMKKRYPEALVSLDKAIQLDEYATNAWLLKGSVNYLQRNFEGAKIAWERTLKLDPYNKAAFSYLNNVYKELNEAPLVSHPGDLRQPASTLEINRRVRQRTQR